MLSWSQFPLTITNNSPTVTTASFRLSHLARHHLLKSSTVFTHFQHQTGLADFFWEATYSQTPNRPQNLAQALQQAHGLIIFLHGCNGSHDTWQDLPQQLVACYPQLVCLNPDINGFGQSPFIADLPKSSHSGMVGAMAAIEQWLHLLNLWPMPQRLTKPFYLFVGHSMGGGMLFYKNQPEWQNDVYGCYLMSPSMFQRDLTRKIFYQIVGKATLTPHVTPIKQLVAYLMVWLAMNDASHPVKQIHATYDTTFGTLGATLYGIGKSPPSPRTDWRQYKIVMGNRDVVVNPRKTLKFAEQLGFQSNQVRVMLGDHYFFSHDESSTSIHRHNRQMVVEDLLAFCRQLAHQAQAQF